MIGGGRRRQVGEVGGSRGIGEAAGSATSIKSILKRVESHIGFPRGRFSCAVIAFRPASCNWKLRSSFPIPRRVGSAAAGAEDSRQYAPRTTPDLSPLNRCSSTNPVRARARPPCCESGKWLGAGKAFAANIPEREDKRQLSVDGKMRETRPAAGPAPPRGHGACGSQS